MTMRTPGTVSEVSAIEVARTTRRCVVFAQSEVLGFGREVAMQRQDEGGAAIERGLGAADFGHAGEEDEDVALVRDQGLADGVGGGGGELARRWGCRAWRDGWRRGTCGRRSR